jgi:LPS-assembly lipoprotein
MNPSKAVTIVSSFVLALATGGCFTPLYGEASHPGVSEEMRAIEIDQVNYPRNKGKVNETGIAAGEDSVDRVGHYLREDLIFDFNGTGTAPPPKYRLRVSTTKGLVTPTIETQESLATSSITQVTATYQLLPSSGGSPLLTGTADSSKTQDILLTRYGNMRALRDAEIRIAKSLADEIELRVAAWLADKQTR